MAAAVGGGVASITIAISSTALAGCGILEPQVPHLLAWGPLRAGGLVADDSNLQQERMEEHIELEGNIKTVLPGTMFRVELDNKHQVLAHISGKMRKRFIRLTVGDRVKLEMSPYDLQKARIVYRLQ